ncbi:hypothetical protein [Denitromonas ohlonensis]|uniref:Uncharacterized protein n=2 Tax=Denitromonas TaxID=139331 RepID=A0A557RLE4_9RHOO|nr:hypothetical protein [Denitromonas ohlonensis]TVO65935.1 hypothetical protein FHP90_10710 [Denitromonas ohlonensis]TVO79528.1 hypothetical protein FHP89_01895 [Denitromonas ohlonensis]
MTDPDDEGLADALAAINATHTNGGRLLSKQDAIEFITKPIYLGHPKTAPYRGRGRRPTRTQYDDALDRRKGPYQRLVNLPTHRLNSGDVPSNIIVGVGRQLRPTTPKRDLARKVEEELDRKYENAPHRDNIRRHLKKAGLLD